MPLRLRKSPDEATKTDRAPFSQSEFIPIASHYNAETLLTKNGELMQILRIRADVDGLDYESPTALTSLREALREAIRTHIGSDLFSFWFHTIRRRLPITQTASFAHPFAQAVHKAWQEEKAWHYSYRNEVYVSILHQGMQSDMQMRALPKRLAVVSSRKSHEAFLEQAYTELEQATSGILTQLASHFTVERLALREALNEKGEAAIISEPLELFHTLINLRPGNLFLTDTDLSQLLSSGDISFGFDAMENREAGNRRFAALLSIKGYAELPPQTLDRCLQLPMELAVSQTFHFLPKAQALSSLDEIQEILNHNPNRFVAQTSGIQARVEAEGKLPLGEQQTSIMIMSDRYNDLDSAVGRIQKTLADIGLLAVREDIKLEECFWAQLPGNFDFLRRRLPIPTSYTASLARLNDFPSGAMQDVRWGKPVAILPTARQTPYFFHFHIGDNGHTALLDFNSFADEKGALLLNFLLSQSMQYNPRIIVFDRGFAAKPLVNALDGQYYRFGTSHAAPRLNPLALENTRRIHSFLAAWLSHCLPNDMQEQESVREHLRTAVDRLFDLPQEQRSFAQLRTILAATAPQLAHALIIPSEFSEGADELDLSNPITGFDLGRDGTRDITPLFSYLLHRVILQLDGTPTIVVLNEAWELLGSPFFVERMASLMHMLTQNNALLVLTTRRFEQFATHPLTPLLLEQVATRILIPDDIPVDFFPEITGLTRDEARALNRMERQQGECFIQHGHERVHCKLDARWPVEIERALNGDVEQLRLMQIQQR